jgi:ADP-heptose:LPS heptosyltransferase
LRESTQNILVYRLGSLGDTVIALPALHWIHGESPGARITLLTNSPINAKASPAAAVLESTGLVNDYLAYPLGTRNPVALFRLRRNIASRRFDLVFALNEPRGRIKSIRDWVFFRSCGIRKVVGIALRQQDLTAVPLMEGRFYESEASRLLRRVGAQTAVDWGDDRWWDLHLSSKERAMASELMGQHSINSAFLAFCLGTKFEVNDWTLPNWCELAGRLGRRYAQIPLIGLGVAEEHQKTEAVLRRWPGRRLNLCGLASPRVSGAVLERAAVFVGHDSGPMHLAAAVGTKCVAIFSARNPPGQWFPRGLGHQVLYHRTECSNCGLSTCEQHAKKCILGISVEEVAKAVERVIGAGDPRLAPSGPVSSIAADTLA